jgi:hypothetical protein
VLQRVLLAESQPAEGAASQQVLQRVLLAEEVGMAAQDVLQPGPAAAAGLAAAPAERGLASQQRLLQRGLASQQRVLQRVLQVGQDVLPGSVTAAIQSSPVDLG